MISCPMCGRNDKVQPVQEAYGQYAGSPFGGQLVPPEGPRNSQVAPAAVAGGGVLVGLVAAVVLGLVVGLAAILVIGIAAFALWASSGREHRIRLALWETELQLWTHGLICHRCQSAFWPGPFGPLGLPTPVPLAQFRSAVREYAMRTRQLMRHGGGPEGWGLPGGSGM